MSFATGLRFALLAGILGCLWFWTMELGLSLRRYQQRLLAPEFRAYLGSIAWLAPGSILAAFAVRRLWQRERAYLERLSSGVLVAYLRCVLAVWIHGGCLIVEDLGKGSSIWWRSWIDLFVGALYMPFFAHADPAAHPVAFLFSLVALLLFAELEGRLYTRCLRTTTPPRRSAPPRGLPREQLPRG